MPLKSKLQCVADDSVCTWNIRLDVRACRYVCLFRSGSRFTSWENIEWPPIWYASSSPIRIFNKSSFGTHSKHVKSTTYRCSYGNRNTGYWALEPTASHKSNTLLAQLNGEFFRYFFLYSHYYYYGLFLFLLFYRPSFMPRWARYGK